MNRHHKNNQAAWQSQSTSPAQQLVPSYNACTFASYHVHERINQDVNQIANEKPVDQAQSIPSPHPNEGRQRYTFDVVMETETGRERLTVGSQVPFSPYTMQLLQQVGLRLSAELKQQL